MAFTKLKIRNFQAQEELEIALGPVTVITGPSDRGKSSCIRALAWLLYNEAPRDCITWGKDFCSVVLEVDGHVVERRRDKKGNFYILDGKQFACLRGGVPPEVQNVLNVVADNIQRQHDSVFWFSETAGEVARRLNSVVNLDIIDRVFEAVSSRTRKVNAELDVVQGFADKYRKEVEAMAELPKFEQAVDKLKELKKAKELKEALRLKLEPRLWKLRKLQSAIPAMEATVSLANSWLAEEDRWQSLSQTVAKLDGVLSKVHKVDSFLAVSPPSYADVETAFEEFERFSSKLSRLNSSVELINAKKIAIYKLEAELRNEEKSFLEKSGGRCPLCGGEIDGAVLS